MKNLNRKRACPAASKWSFTLLLGALVMFTAGCEPDSSDGDALPFDISGLLPTDGTLNLECPDVGIGTEDCVLNDPENPYRNVGWTEFDNNTGAAATKFDFAPEKAQWPCAIAAGGATGCVQDAWLHKAEFYFWATALARASYLGENQWYAADKLHALYCVQSTATTPGDPVIRAQALRAYESVLKNYFGSVTTFANVQNVPFGPGGTQLNLLTGFNLACPSLVPAGPAPAPLLPGCNLFPQVVPNNTTRDPATHPTAFEQINEWGFSYILSGHPGIQGFKPTPASPPTILPCTGLATEDGLLTVNTFEQTDEGSP